MTSLKVGHIIKKLLNKYKLFERRVESVGLRRNESAKMFCYSLTGCTSTPMT